MKTAVVYCLRMKKESVTSMPGICTCETREGEVITGNVKWLPDEVNRMDAFTLIEVLTEMRTFAGYYTESFYKPLKALEAENRRLVRKIEQTRGHAILCGTLTVVSTLTWIVLALWETTRFSPISFVMAAMTMVSILAFVPQLVQFLRVNGQNGHQMEANAKRIAGLKEQRREKIYGQFRDQLLSGYVVLPDYSLCVEALDAMLQALYNHRASGMGETVRLYESEQKVRFPKSGLTLISLKKQTQAAKAPGKTVPLPDWDGCPDPAVLRRIAQYLQKTADSLENQTVNYGSLL